MPAEFSIETLAEVLVETRAMRRALRVAPAEACEVTLVDAHDSPSLPEGDPEALEHNHDKAAQ